MKTNLTIILSAFLFTGFNAHASYVSLGDASVKASTVNKAIQTCFKPELLKVWTQLFPKISTKEVEMKQFYRVGLEKCYMNGPANTMDEMLDECNAGSDNVEFFLGEVSYVYRGQEAMSLATFSVAFANERVGPSLHVNRGSSYTSLDVNYPMITGKVSSKGDRLGNIISGSGRVSNLKIRFVDGEENEIPFVNSQSGKASVASLNSAAITTCLKQALQQ